MVNEKKKERKDNRIAAILITSVDSANALNSPSYKNTRKMGKAQTEKLEIKSKDGEKH